MQLIRSNRPEMSLPSNRLQNWFGQPFEGGRLWPALFDWDSLWDTLTPSNRVQADLFEDEEAYHVRMEMPGVKKENVSVELENAVLTVSYEQRGSEAGNGESTESYTRSVSVPDGIVPERISAKLEDGILHVMMPKAESKKPQKIAVS